MRAVVIGAGSIGKRHLRNLLTLGVRSLAVCDPDPASRDTIAKELCLTQSYESLERAGLMKGDAVFIATPNHLHATQALFAAKQGCHLFVEKPLAHNRTHVEELCRVVDENRLVTMGGCNMRFYPAIQMLKSFLQESKIGRILYYRVEVGIYLPNWRPHLDYRKNYGAHRSQGGGSLLDMIHEIDYARWLFGDPVRVSGNCFKVSGLEIDTEDLAELILFHGDRVGSIHLDYLSHRYTRTVHIVGEKGDLFWDWHQRLVEWVDAATKSRNSFPLPENYDLNQMYLDETRYFLECIRLQEETFFPIREAARVLEIALTAKESSEEERILKLTPHEPFCDVNTPTGPQEGRHDD